MKRIVLLLLAVLTVQPQASRAQDMDPAAAYLAAVAALPDRLPLVTTPACLAGAVDAPPVEVDAETLSRYRIAFDEAAASDALDRVARLMEPASGIDPPRAEDLLPDSPAVGISRSYNEFGLDPADVLDVAAFYLLVIWVAQEGDEALVASDPTGILVVLRRQLLAAELRCFVLGKEADDLAATRNEMIALTGLLVEAFEVQGRAGTPDKLGAPLRASLGRQIQGLRLTEAGFVPD